MSPSARRSILTVTALFTTVGLILILLCPLEVHWSPDSAAKQLAVMSIRYENGFRYDVPYLGRSVDPGLRALPIGQSYFDVKNGQVRISWPELFPLLVWPFYKLLGWRGLFALPLICGALAIHTTGRIAEEIRPGTGLAASIIAAACTPILVYATLLWEHTPALALMLFAALRITRFLATHAKRNLILAGAAIAIASGGFRTDANLFFAAALAALFLVERRLNRISSPLTLSLGFALGFLPVGALNWVTNGKLLAANTAKNVPPPSLGYLKQVGVGVLTHFFVGNTVPSNYGWIVVVGAAALLVARYLKADWRAWACAAAGAVLLTGCSLALYDTYRTNQPSFYGWLAMSPLLALGLFPTPRDAPDRRHDFIVLAAIVYGGLNFVALTLAYPYGWAADGNLEWGPRYWLPLFPMLAIGTALNWKDIVRELDTRAQRIMTVTAGCLFAIGVLYQGYGIYNIHDGEEDSGKNGVVIQHLIDVPIVTDMFFMTSLAPDQFFTRPSYYFTFNAPEAFASWMPAAAERGLTTFDLVTFGDPYTHPFANAPLDGWKLVVTSDQKYRNLNVARVHAVRLSEAP